MSKEPARPPQGNEGEPKTWIDFLMGVLGIFVDKVENGDFGEEAQKSALETKVQGIHQMKKLRNKNQ